MKIRSSVFLGVLSATLILTTGFSAFSRVKPAEDPLLLSDTTVFFEKSAPSLSPSDFTIGQSGLNSVNVTTGTDTDGDYVEFELTSYENGVVYWSFDSQRYLHDKVVGMDIRIKLFEGTRVYLTPFETGGNHKYLDSSIDGTGLLSVSTAITIGDYLNQWPFVGFQDGTMTPNAGAKFRIYNIKTFATPIPVAFDFRAGAATLDSIHNWQSNDAAYTDVDATAGGFDEESNFSRNNVWFKFQATTSEIDFRVRTGDSYGTMSATFLTLYNSSGNIVTSNAETVFPTALIQTVSLTPGSTYYVAVDSQVPGTFSLQVSDSVGYDMREKALLLSNIHNLSSSSAQYSDVDATGHGFNEESDFGRNNVWFKFQATTNELDFRVLTGDSYGTMSATFLRLFNSSGDFITSNAETVFPTALIQTVSLTPGSTYYVAVDSQVPGTFSLQVSDSVGYDMREKALLLSNIHNWSSSLAQYSDVDATGHGFNEESDFGRNNVWFKFQAATSEIDFRVLKGESHGTISAVFMSLFDSVGNRLISSVTDEGLLVAFQYISLTPGADYYVSVDSQVPGTFTLQVNDSVGYDMRLKAVLLDNIHNWSSANAQYSDVGATGRGFDEDTYLGKNNVWFKFQATTSQIDFRVLTGDVYGTATVPFVRLYNESGSQVAFSSNENTSTLALMQYSSLTPGSNYYVVVDTPVPGTFTIMINDAFGYDMRAHAVVIDNLSNWTTGDAAYSNVGATGHGFNEELEVAKNNVWFVFQAETDRIDIRALTSSEKGTLSGIKLTLFDSQGNVLADSVSTSSFANILYTSLVPDSVYYISVDDTNTPGTFTLQIQDELTNDFYSHAMLLSNIADWTSGDAAFTNINATPDFTGSPCGGPFHNVWYKFQASDNNIEIEVTSGGNKGTLQYPMITLFDFDSLSVGCNGGLHRAVIDSVSVTPGNWYYLSVDNYQDNPGSFTLKIKNNSDSIPIVCSAEFVDEYHALMDLYSASGGTSWTNNSGWRDANPSTVSSFNGWYGITTNSQGHISNLDLHANNLSGTLPESIGDLVALNKLNLSNNQLTGDIPDELGNLGCLKELLLEQNSLSGILPEALGNLSNLTVLKAGNNKIIGIIPYAFGNLVKLTYLDMHADSLSGQIPSSLDTLTELTYIDLSSNQLVGSIPQYLGNLSHLNAIRLGSNQFSGPIPSELGNLTQLKVLNLSNNLLTDSIPSAIGNLHALDSLFLQNNQLTDTIPTSLESLTNLKKLYLNNNNLDGSINFVTGLTILTELSVGNNNFGGPIADLSGLANLQVLEVNDNNFNSLPSNILTLAHLRRLNLNGNRLNALPDFSTYSNRANLDLKIDQNDFTFSIIIPLVNAGLHSLDYAPQNLIDAEKSVKAAIGQPLVLITTVDRTTNPASDYQWFKLEGDVETPLNTASTSGYTVTIPSMSQNDEGSRYIYKISNPTGNLVLVSNVQTYEVVVCNQLSINIQSDRIDGKYLFTPILSSLNAVCNLSYSWDFGDGTTSTVASPSHAYTSGGNYTINLTIVYACDGCAPGNATAQTQITIDQAFCGVIYCDGDGIGIGTTQIPSGYKLAVKGKVIMEGARVAMQARWPDYVFEKDYSMMKLPELKDYISKNSHLPGIPSAATVKKEGIDIGNMNALLLEKIEELTLYMIKLDEQVRELESDKKTPKK